MCLLYVREFLSLFRFRLIDVIFLNARDTSNDEELLRRDANRSADARESFHDTHTQHDRLLHVEDAARAEEIQRRKRGVSNVASSASAHENRLAAGRLALFRVADLFGKMSSTHGNTAATLSVRLRSFTSAIYFVQASKRW